MTRQIAARFIGAIVLLAWMGNWTPLIAQTSGIVNGQAGTIAKTLWLTCTAGQILVKDTTKPYGVACAAASSGSGDVVGPASAVDSGLVLFNGTTGKLVKDGGALGTGVLTWLGTPSSANLASAITDETGSGLAVFATSPTLTTPVLGAATGTSLSLSGALTLGTDVILQRDAANVLVQRNGTNAQQFYLYQTFTDASNYERLNITASGTAYQIGHKSAGTGLGSRAVNFLYGNNTLTALSIGVFNDSITMAFGGATSSVFPRVVVGSGAFTATSGTAGDLKLGSSAAPTSTSTMLFQSLLVSPTINYSAGTPGAGSYEAIKIAVTETALPTGTNYLIRASAGAAGTTDRFFVTNGGDVSLRHAVAIGTAPTLDTGCGTGTLATGASDGAGKITTNTTGACTIVMTFGTAWARAPSCSVNNETTANLSRSTTTTTTATLTGTTVSGDVWSYHCFGY